MLLVHRIRTLVFPATTVLLALLGACKNAAAPRDAVGTYALRTVEGLDMRVSGPVDAATLGWSGYVTLESTLAAERVMQFKDTPATRTSGTFRVWGTRLELRLHETAGGNHVWTPSATLVDGVLTIRYGSAVDGPDIVETYIRP